MKRLDSNYHLRIELESDDDARYFSRCPQYQLLDYTMYFIYQRYNLNTGSFVLSISRSHDSVLVPLSQEQPSSTPSLIWSPQPRTVSMDLRGQVRDITWYGRYLTDAEVDGLYNRWNDEVPIVPKGAHGLLWPSSCNLATHDVSVRSQQRVFIANLLYRTPGNKKYGIGAFLDSNGNPTHYEGTRYGQVHYNGVCNPFVDGNTFSTNGNLERIYVHRCDTDNFVIFGITSSTHNALRFRYLIWESDGRVRLSVNDATLPGQRCNHQNYRWRVTDTGSAHRSFGHWGDGSNYLCASRSGITSGWKHRLYLDNGHQMWHSENHGYQSSLSRILRVYTSANAAGGDNVDGIYCDDRGGFG